MKIEEILRKTYGIETIIINGCILVPLYQVEDKLKKLAKIEQIVNAELYVNGSQGKIEDIKEILEQE